MGPKLKNEIAFQIIGYIAPSVSILLWIVFLFFNPYASSDSAVPFGTRLIGCGMIALAILAILAAYFRSPWLMYLSFALSLPMGLYMLASPSIFCLIGISTLFYLVSGIGMHKSRER